MVKIKKKQQSIQKNTHLKKEIWRHRELYLFLLPAIVFKFIFHYIPIYGVGMAFQDVKIGDAFGQSAWIGLYHFKRFFSSHWFPILMKNTLSISFLTNVLTWPFPLILALLLHNSSNKRLSKVVQNVTYLPYLLSVVIIVSILNVFCGDTGIINILLKNAGLQKINFFGDPDWVYPFHVILGVWKGTGYGAIIFLSALSGVDEEMIEAAKIDGAGKLRVIWNIQLPMILPTIITLLILNLGSSFNVGVDQALLLQTDLNLRSSEVISTYVYKTGVSSMQYGFSTAVGLFQTLVNFILMLTVNMISKKTTDMSII